METILHVATVAEVACPPLKLGVGGGAHDATRGRPESWARATPTRSMQDFFHPLYPRGQFSLIFTSRYGWLMFVEYL